MKLKIALLSLVLGLGAFFHPVMAQSLTVSGTVLNQTSEPLVGATVSVENSSRSTVTDETGRFSISVNKGAVLVISYTGMTPYRVTVNSEEVLSIQLQDAQSSLNEVIVVGYGTQKVTKVSGAISTIKASDIEKLKPVRTEEALQGRASGVSVIQSGTPGSKPTVLIRGIPSFSGTDPIVIIDGVPQTLTDLNAINASDIESINVLKDAATTAIYGVKGGNGVIVVTTRSGRKNQKTEINITSNYGVQEVINTIGVLNATEYGAMINEGSTVSGGPVIFPNLSILGKGTNWQNEIFETASLQNHNITARGGAERMSYFLSAGYLSQGGIVGGNDKSRFNRGNLTANLNFDLSKKLKFILNTSAVLLDAKGIQENSFNSVIGSALNFDPTVPVYNTDPNMAGTYGYSNLLLSEIFNPLTKLDNTYNKNV
ncbi:MAG: TonB-dependent receptor plug domain-containing protein, partial [Flavitalea sp.]